MSKKIKIDRKKIVKRAPVVSTVQAIIFGNQWKAVNAKKWMKENEFKILTDKSGKERKVHKTKDGFLKYTIEDADKFQSLSFKKTNKGISFVLGLTPRLKKHVKVTETKET